VGAGVVGTAVGTTGAEVAIALLVHAVRNNMAASKTGSAVREKLDMDISRFTWLKILRQYCNPSTLTTHSEGVREGLEQLPK
jgi:hypothetical protein